MPSSKGSSQLRDQTQVFHIAGGFFTIWATVEAEVEAPPTLWPPDAKSWLIGKDPDAGKDWRQKEKGVTEDEMIK